MSGKNANAALMVAHGVGAPIAFNASGGAAEWIMLLPAGAGGVIATVDGRGPYRVKDAAQLALHSLEAAGGRLPVDENHATDLAAPNGGPSPARGWAVELAARNDGIWGRVEWSVPGAALMSEKAYRFISPVFTHDNSKTITGLLRASLTNTPNLRGIAALHTQESNMDLLATLRKLLGLADDADEAAVIAKVKAWSEEGDEAIATAAIKKALAPIAKAANLQADADAVAIASAVTTLVAGGKSPATDETVVSLQSELATVTKSLNALVVASAKEKAVAYVDGEIAKGRVGVKPMRDTYIAMHAADAAQVEKLIGAMPIMQASGALTTPPAAKDGQVALNAEQLNAAKVLGIKPEDYAKTLADEAA